LENPTKVPNVNLSLTYEKTKQAEKRIDFVLGQGAIWFKSGAYTEYVSILNRIATQP